MSQMQDVDQIVTQQQLMDDYLRPGGKADSDRSGGVWREYRFCFYIRTRTWSCEHQAKNVLHSCADGWKLLLTKTRQLLARRGLIHESSSRNPNNTTQMLDTHLNPNTTCDYFLITDSEKISNLISRLLQPLPLVLLLKISTHAD